MPVTPTIQNVKPTVGASADVWGGILNDRVGETYVDINALAVQGNANEAAVVGAMPKTGGAFSGPVTVPDVGPASPLNVGYRGAPVIGFDTDRTLLLSDAGKMLRLFGPTSRTLTIPPLSSVGFPLGTVILLRSYTTTVPWNIARGAGVTLTVAGSNVNKNCQMATFGFGSLTLEDTNIWVLSGVGVS